MKVKSRIIKRDYIRYVDTDIRKGDLEAVIPPPPRRVSHPLSVLAVAYECKIFNVAEFPVTGQYSLQTARNASVTLVIIVGPLSLKSFLVAERGPILGVAVAGVVVVLLHAQFTYILRRGRMPQDRAARARRFAVRARCQTIPNAFKIS